MPRWIIIMWVAGFILLAGSATFAVVDKCGWKALMLGNGAGFAAMSGMCD
jgi:hypothetical protein